MATSKTTKKPTANKPSPPSAKPADKKATKEGRAIDKLLARRGPVDAAHRAAYAELITDEGRAALGVKTRGPGVFRDAVAWCVQIDEAFAKYPAHVKAHYADTLVAYLLEQTALLGAAIDAQQTRRGEQHTTRSTMAEREEAARAARAELISALRGFAGRRDAERNALSLALGRTDSLDAVAGSLRALAALGAEWLARSGATAAIQAASAGLTNEGVAAVDALTGAASKSTLAGRRPAVDAPEVNLVEGTVLNEMDEAQRCFEEAHLATPLIRRLTPGPATRQVLGSKKASKAAAAEAPAADAPAAAAGAP